mmetsp:Transcript_9097/g.18425  ORF Transcript_9097/g.18425 Transcript_9097/m.18425 type:complete len:122 (-) Transcript_9097:186-551(-)
MVNLDLHREIESSCPDPPLTCSIVMALRMAVVSRPPSSSWEAISREMRTWTPEKSNSVGEKVVGARSFPRRRNGYSTLIGARTQSGESATPSLTYPYHNEAKTTLIKKHSLTRRCLVTDLV